MHLGQDLWKNKEASRHLLEVAILLALLQGIIVDHSNFNLPIRFGKFSGNSLPAATLEQFPDWQHDNNPKVQNILLDHRENTNSTVRGKSLNDSVIAALIVRNITVNMVLVSSMSVEENLTQEHTASSSVSGFEMGRDAFSFENIQALSGWNETSNNMSDNVSEQSTNSQTFTNADDVRWRQFLNINDSETSQQHCSSSNCTENNISKSESFTSISSISQGFTTSKDNPLDISNFLHNTFDYLNASEKNVPSTSRGSTFSFDARDQELRLNQTNSKDADLMQMLYQQDVDLGYNNWQPNESVKQLKEVDDIQRVKNDLLNVEDFFIDGETGEQIPIARNQVAAQQAPSMTQYQVPVTGNTEGGGNFNIEDCLEILEHNMDDMGPQKTMNQTSVDDRNNMVKNLTSLIDTNGNSSPVQAPNPDLWQQIDELSELTGLNLHEMNQPMLRQPQDEMNANFNSYNGQVPAIEPRSIEQPYNFNSINYNGMGQMANTSPTYGSPIPQPSYPVATFPSLPNPTVQTPASYISPPMVSDDGIPMDTSFSPMGSPDKQEPTFPVNNFNNFNNFDASPLGPSLSSLPEPGQSFFDYLQPDNNVTVDMVPTPSAISSFSNQVNAPYMNPPVASYPPPPLNTATSSSFLDEMEQRMTSTVDEKAIVESYESDSGVSLDQSPRGLEFLTLSPNEDTAYSSDLSLIKSEPSDHEQGFLPELKTIHHNHTYNGTIGVTKQERKKMDKAAQLRESRDERKARELNLPFSLEDIILSPVEEYNEMLARTPLNPSQQALVKDIRRRGKNKVAAQNCRKRKIETISNMEGDVGAMRSRKQQLVDEQKDLEMKYEAMKRRYSSLYQQIFSSFRDDSGRPYDPNHFRLEQVEGAVLLVPHVGQGDDGEDGSSSGEVDYNKIKMEKHR